MLVSLPMNTEGVDSGISAVDEGLDALVCGTGFASSTALMDALDDGDGVVAQPARLSATPANAVLNQWIPDLVGCLLIFGTTFLTGG